MVRITAIPADGVGIEVLEAGIISDLGSALAGSLGLAASANLNPERTRDVGGTATTREVTEAIIGDLAP
ncbi:hypothetical protein DMB66_01240 [Actinoplanes sp. ATCC 53533]|nr:hypothetical protein DMB66_01240 [Actinoplanes sp. ATCC 53533]